jgi:hypothetical protein
MCNTIVHFKPETAAKLGSVILFGIPGPIDGYVPHFANPINKEPGKTNQQNLHKEHGILFDWYYIMPYPECAVKLIQTLTEDQQHQIQVLMMERIKRTTSKTTRNPPLAI